MQDIQYLKETGTKKMKQMTEDKRNKIYHDKLNPSNKIYCICSEAWIYRNKNN